MKKIFSILFVLSFALLPVLSLNAADYLPKTSKDGGNVVVGGSQIYQNLYVGGGSVVINNNTLGDLFVGGGGVSLTGEIEKDLFVGGGNINIGSPVGEDARIAGGNISIDSLISGDLLVAGGTVAILNSTQVGGDFWVAGGIVNMNGNVSGEARITGGEIFINGTISGPVTIRSEKLVFGPQAQVSGPISYSGKSEAVIQEGAQVGTIEFKEWTGKDKNVVAFGGIFVLVKLLALFITALILLKLFRSKISELVNSTYDRLWLNLGMGIVFMIVIPIVSVILLGTVVGIYLGIILGLIFGLLVTTGGILVIIFMGKIIEKLAAKNQETPITWKTILWGTLVSAILALIPVIGWLAIVIMYLMIFGALVRSLRNVFEF